MRRVKKYKISVWSPSVFSVIVALCASCSEQQTPSVVEATEATAEAVPEAPKTLGDLASQLEALPDDTPVKLLFALSVKLGEITKKDEGRRELTFMTEEISSITAFTDRPERHAFSLTVGQLASVWEAGSDSFAKDPPNAVVEDSRARTGVTEVTGFSVAEGSVTIQLDRMAYKSLDEQDSLDGLVKDLTLFIDSDALKLTGASVAFGLQQAAKACVSVDCELWPLGG
tara:strand:- start:2404 stop:3087 length:684 start_codon:yes stop_codon:yes gene_type:complete